jgi:RNA polymerase sigma factor, sigma-70 family
LPSFQLIALVGNLAVLNVNSLAPEFRSIFCKHCRIFDVLSQQYLFYPRETGGLFIFREGRQIDKPLLCQQFKPLVKKYAGIYRRSVTDAESEAWLVLLQAIHTFNPDLNVPLAGYLESRVKYGLLNLWRKEMKRKQMESQGDKALEYVVAPDDPQAELIYKETIERMLAALKELSPRQLLVLIHIFVYGRKLEYIAQVLGITAQAVYQKRGR